jgi:hypothetical protein
MFDSAYYLEPNGTVVQLRSLDASLVAPGDIHHLLRFDNTLPDASAGMHIQLYNNLWGTAFRQWYSEDAQYRFELSFCASECPGPTVSSG